jgi:hypothetical protein
MNSGPIETSLGWPDQMGRLGLLLLSSSCIKLGQAGAYIAAAQKRASPRVYQMRLLFLKIWQNKKL